MNAIYKNVMAVAAPRVIVEGRKYLGIAEIKGKLHSATIMKWAKDLGLASIYTNDEIPWCGLFVAKVVSQSGFQPVNNPLWALNWSKFGTAQKIAMLGDVLVFTRPSGGHVGFYVGEDSEAYHVLGGNQSDMVSITRIAKSRCVAIRRCPWKVAQPVEVKRIFLSASGKLSTNEA